MITMYNQLMLCKGDCLPQCGWATSNQLKAFKAKHCSFLGKKGFCVKTGTEILPELPDSGPILQVVTQDCDSNSLPGAACWPTHRCWPCQPPESCEPISYNKPLVLSQPFLPCLPPRPHIIQPLTLRNLPKRNEGIYPYKDMSMDVHSSFICKSQKLEPPTLSSRREQIHEWIQITVCIHPIEYFLAKKGINY